MTSLPLVSIITLNYNQTSTTCAFLESTRLLTYPHYEIIVVDNHSTVDPTDQILAVDAPYVQLIISQENLGFAGGNNFGMRYAKGDYIFLVNDDTEVTPSLIEDVLAPFLEDKRVGVVSPKIKFYDHPDVIQYAGFQRMNPYTGRTVMVGNHELDRGQWDISGETYGAHGAAMMIKREVIEKVGMFSDTFFLYYEEWDWSTRIRRAGYKIFYQSRAVIYHKESMSVGKDNPIKAYYHTRNRILYMRRNTKKSQFLLFTLFFTLFTFPKSIFKYLVGHQFAHLKAFLRGVLWHLKSSPSSKY